MNTANERELLDQLREGSEQAWDYFYRQYRVGIYRKLLKMIKIEAIAEELVQDVFVKLWNKRHLIDPNQPFHAYLYSIAQNLVYDFYRKIAKDKRLQEQVKALTINLYQHIEEDIDLKETQGIIHQAINHLPSQQKLIFTLCKLEGKSYQYVGTSLGISTSTVNNHIVKATKKIKGYIIKFHRTILFVSHAIAIMWSIAH